MTTVYMITLAVFLAVIIGYFLTKFKNDSFFFIFFFILPAAMAKVFVVSVFIYHEQSKAISPGELESSLASIESENQKQCIANVLLASSKQESVSSLNIRKAKEICSELNRLNQINEILAREKE